MLNTYNKRLNAKMAYDADPTKWLSTSVNVLVNHTWGRYTPEDGGGQEARRTMIEMLPWPVYEPGTNSIRLTHPHARAVSTWRVCQASIYLERSA